MSLTQPKRSIAPGAGRKENGVMSKNQKKLEKLWTIIFCSECREPTPPGCGMMTDHLGFVCDECLNTEMDKYDEPA